MERSAKQFRKRNAILEYLRGTTDHPSAEAVYEAVRKTSPDISLATVYRNLSLFKQQGLIMSLGTVDGIERFDGNTAPHVHFICKCCGRVVDLPLLHAPELNAQVTDAIGASVESCQLSFTGTCKDCRTAHEN